MNKNAYFIVGILAIAIVGWFLMRKKKSPESNFRRRSGYSGGGITNRPIYKCKRTYSDCDWGCAGGSITCPPGCMTTKTETFESSGPCPYGSTNLGLIRFD